MNMTLQIVLVLALIAGGSAWLLHDEQWRANVSDLSPEAVYRDTNVSLRNFQTPTPGSRPRNVQKKQPIPASGRQYLAPSYIIALDNDRNNNVTEKSVLQGDDAILLLARKGSLANGRASGRNAKAHVFMFQGLESLAQYDLDLNGYIDNLDPIYSCLLYTSPSPRDS